MDANVLKIVMITNFLLNNLVGRLENLRSSVVLHGQSNGLYTLDTISAEAAINGNYYLVTSIIHLPSTFTTLLLPFFEEPSPYL